MWVRNVKIQIVVSFYLKIFSFPKSFWYEFLTKIKLTKENPFRFLIYDKIKSLRTCIILQYQKELTEVLHSRRCSTKFCKTHRPEACNFIKKETLAQVFSCKFCEISKNTLFYRTPLDYCLCNILFQFSERFFLFQFVQILSKYTQTQKIFTTIRKIYGYENIQLSLTLLTAK